MSDPVSDWPPGERPRERLDDLGCSALSDAELVALVLRSGGRGASCIEIGRRIVALLGGLRGVARASVAELARIPGIGAARAASLVAAFELGRRSVGARLENGAAFTSSADVFAHFRGPLAGLRREVFHVLLLDAKHRKLRDVRVSEGSLTATLVHPREVFAPAVRESAAAVVLAHNHPSGDPAPSAEDREITRRLRGAGDLVGVRVLDHVIVGAESYFSFADAGEL
jgi:DNA repair protein RadC